MTATARCCHPTPGRRRSPTGQDAYPAVVKQPRVLALVDALAVLVFAAIGRQAHEEGAHDVAYALGQVVGIATPFLAGALVGAVAVRSWRDPLAWRSGVAVWVGAVVVGMLLRWAFVDRPPLSFIVVATISLAVLVLGWRGVVLGIMRLRGRRARQHA
jgi:peptidoglycan/LPS O-acetylase OafA/YrhL